MGKLIETTDLRAYFGSYLAIDGISLAFEPNQVTALIGPSGCGKSTFIRCLNRMHEAVPRARMDGKVMLDGENIYASDVDVAGLRRTVGMVFQRPNPFPTMSIKDNVSAGLRLAGKQKKSEVDERVEQSLIRAGLWDEVKDRLGKPGASLSGGQQQRLCIARAIATQPEVLLMDEPCSSLDPVSTLVIEDLLGELRTRYTIVIVTHNMQQAARVSEATAFFNVDGAGQPGRLVEAGPTSKMFTKPDDERTEAYITGRFG
jgi:phosphate transport system ATP-binding protein